MPFVRKIYLFLLDTVQTLLLAVSIMLVFYFFLFRPFQVHGESMYPTFKNNEFVLTSLITLRFNEPKRGDVIVFRAPTDRDKDFIKRIVGLPGEKIALRGGSIFINDHKLNEDIYLPDELETRGGQFLPEGGEIQIPFGSYVVMGDNRISSSDSKDWGFLKKNDIIGVVIFVYWPIGNIRVVKNPTL
ncbi:MAG: signal peptidase I [Candidatus Levybacteria bacterium]|nr:signal peptidase I [Candidatus Levybacteria bacterium]